MFIYFVSMTKGSLLILGSGLGRLMGEGGWSGTKTFAQISVSEGLLSFKRKYEMAFKLVGPLSWSIRIFTLTMNCPEMFTILYFSSL